MKDFHIEEEYIKKQKYKVWVLVFGMALLTSSKILIIGLLGVVLAGLYLGVIWKKIYKLFKCSISCDRDGIWLTHRKKSNGLVKWEDMKSTKKGDDGLDIFDKNDTLILSLSNKLEHFEDLEDIVKKRISGEIEEDKMSEIFELSKAEDTVKYPLTFSSGKFYDFSINTFFGAGVSIFIGFLITYFANFSGLQFIGFGIAIIYFIFFVMMIFWSSPKKLEIYEDKLKIFYMIKKESVMFENIEKVDLYKFASRKDNETSKVRIVTKDEQYFAIYDFYQDDEDILKSIKNEIEKYKNREKNI